MQKANKNRKGPTDFEANHISIHRPNQIPLRPFSHKSHHHHRTERVTMCKKTIVTSIYCFHHTEAQPNSGEPRPKDAETLRQHSFIQIDTTGCKKFKETSQFCDIPDPKYEDVTKDMLNYEYIVLEHTNPGEDEALCPPCGGGLPGYLEGSKEKFMLDYDNKQIDWPKQLIESKPARDAFDVYLKTVF